MFILIISKFIHICIYFLCSDFVCFFILLSLNQSTSVSGTIVDMPPTNISSWLNALFNSVPDVKTVQQLHEISIFSPNKQFSEDIQLYFIYCQPILISLILIWMGVSLKIVWTDDFRNKYGLMTAYTSLEIVACILQNIACILVFSTESNYVEYEWCYVYEAASEYIPGCLHLISKGLRIGHALLIVILLYTPLKFKTIINIKACVLFCTLTVFCSCTVFVTHFLLSVRFEKTTVFDQTTQEIKAVCRHKDGFVNSNTINEDTEFVRQIIMDVMSHIAPTILMICLSIAIHLLLKKQIKTRLKLQRECTERVKSDTRLARVTLVATLISTIFTLPAIPTTIVLNTELKSLEGAINILEIINTVVKVTFILNVPINFFIFSWLSKDFRENIMKILKSVHLTQKKPRGHVSSQEAIIE